MRIFQRIHHKLNWSKKQYTCLIAGVLLVGYASSAIYHTVKPIPVGLDYAGPLHYTDAQFLSDQTYLNAQGQQEQHHQIFDEMLKMINEAKTTIVLDMFLLNDEVGESKQKQRALTKELAEALIRKRALQPNISITVLTDPINSMYGGFAPEQYVKLRRVGVDLIETNLTPLRASNPAWSGLWYLCCQNLGNNNQRGWLANPFGDEKVTIRSYLNLLNFKANHRKTLVVDTPRGWQALVTSQNIHAGSSRHDNAALVITGAAAVDVLNTEQPVAQMSGGTLPAVLMGGEEANHQLPQVQVLTEEAIYRAVLKLIQGTQRGETLQMAMFYLSERQIIEALKAAQERGVHLNILLDPNKDAFGHQKVGMPNRQVAMELHQAGVPVRWCDTHGEQCHSKLVIKRGNAESEMLLGSANLTARNLKNYNLETDLRVIGSNQLQVFKDAESYFNTSWSNLNGQQMSVNYEKYEDSSKMRYWLYRFLEWSGISTF